MKLTKKELGGFKKILCKLHFEYRDTPYVLVFPIEKEVTTDAFGLAINTMKAESRFGNSLLTCLVYTGEDTILGYVPTSAVLSFNLSEFMELTEQEMSDSDKKFLSEFECGIVKEEYLIGFSNELSK